IAGSSGTPSGSYAAYGLYIDYYSSGVAATLSNIRIRNAYTGISFQGGTGHSVSHGQIVNCYNAIAPYSADFNLRNCLIYGSYAIFNSSSGSVCRNENVTFSACSTLGPQYYGYPS